MFIYLSREDAFSISLEDSGFDCRTRSAVICNPGVPPLISFHTSKRKSCQRTDVFQRKDNTKKVYNKVGISTSPFFSKLHTEIYATSTNKSLSKNKVNLTYPNHATISQTGMRKATLTNFDRENSASYSNQRSSIDTSEYPRIMRHLNSEALR